MRVGLLTTSYPRTGVDPAGTFVAGMARYLAGRGARVEVLCAGDAGAPEQEQDGGVTVRRLQYAWPPARQRLFYHGGAPEALAASPHLWAQAMAYGSRLLAAAARRSTHWGAVVSHWLLPAGLVGVAVARGRPHLAVAHSADVHLLERLGPGGPLLARAFGRRGTQVAFASAGLRHRFGALAPAVAAGGLVQPMGIEPEPLCFSPGRAVARRTLGLPSRGVVVLFLGRLVPIKGCDVLLEATRGLTGVTVLVAGEGPARRALERRAGPGVRFLGELGGRARARALAAADLLCLPSRTLPDGRTEGTPTVVLEAQMVGLPVVASDTGGVAGVVRHRIDGLLVPPGDVGALRGALACLADAPQRRRQLARAAAARGADHSWARVGPRLCEPLLDAAARRHHG